MVRIFLYLLLLVPVLTGICVSEDLSRLAELASQSKLEEISEALGSNSGERWPEISSLQIDNEPERERIASLLLSKILQSNTADPHSTVPTLASLTIKLRASGGYCNYVIADTAERLAIASIIKALATVALTPEKAEQLAADLPSAFPTTSDWIRLLHTEMSLAGNTEVLRKTNPENYLNQLVALAGNTDIETIYVKIGQGQATSVKLLKNRDIAVLARKMAETETYRIAHLRALIFFLKNGGDLGEIDLSDVRNVNDIFSKSAAVFASPLLRIRRINAIHLKMMTDDARSPDKTPRVLLGYE